MVNNALKVIGKRRWSGRRQPLHEWASPYLGLLPVAGRYEGEPPHLRGDGADIAEIASLEEVERLPLVEPGLIDARGALRVVVPLRLDASPEECRRRSPR